MGLQKKTALLQTNLLVNQWSIFWQREKGLFHKLCHDLVKGGGWGII